MLARLRALEGLPIDNFVRAWIASSRYRFTRSARRGQTKTAPTWTDLARVYAPGKSFADVGGMWQVNGAIAFAAEDAGAASVTLADIMKEQPEYQAEHQRRGSRVRFVKGDLHKGEVLDEIGVHDVVWCSGVLYHAPNPMLTLGCLRRITRETLILGTASIPELPAISNACIFYPFMDPDDARPIDAGMRPGRRIGLNTEFMADGGFANWFWGFTPSALSSMLRATGFEVLDQIFPSPFGILVVARPLAQAAANEVTGAAGETS